MGAVFLYHCSAPFSYFPWDVTSSPTLGFTVLCLFITGWVMPLFFMISAVSTYFSLKGRSVLQFTKERIHRLMVPFVVGLLFILPVDDFVYYHSVSGYKHVGGFIRFYSGPYFTKYFPLNLNFSPTFFAGPDQGIYLWFLFWLFIFSVITAPCFKWLRSKENTDKLRKLNAVCERRGGILLLAIPIVVVNIAAVPPYFIPPNLLSPYGGWKIPTYFVFFVTAYVMACNPQFEDCLEENRILALLLGIATISLSIGALLSGEADQSGIASYYLPLSVLQALSGWFWVVAILGFGRKYLSFNNTFLQRSNELVLPFYVLHQSVIVLIAFYVVALNLIPVEKFLLILLASFPIVVALLYPISKINGLRYLFGMKNKPET